MADPDVRLIVSNRIKTLWSPVVSGQCKILESNEDGEPPADGTPFLKIQYPLQGAGTITIGAPGNQLVRDNGGIRFVLSVREGTGTEPYLTWIKEIRRLFLNYQDGDFQTFTPSPVTEDDENDISGWFVMSCSVEYFFDTYG